MQVKKIIQTDDDIGRIMEPVSFMIAKMTELFLERLIKKVGENGLDQETTLTTRHLASVIRDDVR